MTAYGTAAFVSVLFIWPTVSTVRPPSSTILPPFIRSLVPFTIPVRSKFGRSRQIVDATLGVLDTATAANWSGVTILNSCSHWSCLCSRYVVYLSRSAAIVTQTTPHQRTTLSSPCLFFLLSFASPAVRSSTSPPSRLVPRVLSSLLRISSSSAAPRRKP